MCDHREKLSVVATMPIPTSYVIFHAMTLFTVFSVGNQGFEDRGNKTPSLRHSPAEPLIFSRPHSCL